MFSYSKPLPILLPSDIMFRIYIGSSFLYMFFYVPKVKSDSPLLCSEPSKGEKLLSFHFDMTTIDPQKSLKEKTA